MNITIADQDSDSLYVTNQIDIANHARYCYLNYPTIINLIPKEKNIYSNSLQDFALVDNKLAAAQLAIGLSSNLAQLCLTYTYNFEDQKYQDYVCILSVLAQVAIDNAKRAYDIDINKEIDLIKNDMDIETNGLPLFWQITKKDKRKCKNEEEKKRRRKANKENIKSKLNEELICPMNYLYGLKLDRFRSEDSTLPMSDFYIKHELKSNHKKAKKVEEMIEKYSLEFYVYNQDYVRVNWIHSSNILLMKSDFNKLVKDIQQIGLSRNYTALMSWLINRAFRVESQGRPVNSNLEKNKSLLIKTLYTVNPKCFLACFKPKRKES